MRCKKSYLITMLFIVSGLICYLIWLDRRTIITFNEHFDYNLQLQKLQNFYGKTVQPVEYIYECCNPNIIYPYRKSILYLKTHKCAGSTLQNILMRFGLRYELNFMLPRDNDSIIAYFQPYTDDVIPANFRTPNGKYDILTHHIKYSPNIKNVLPPGTVSVTMMRSVPSLFESIYYFYRAPFKTGKSIQKYLKNPFDLNVLDGGAPHGLNHMSMDLGFERKDFQNKTAIAEFIEFIDSQFDLVMIVEYIEESFVLLAHLMGWPLDHVSYLLTNRRNEAKNNYQLTESDREKIKQLNNVDTLLYDHFLKKFQKCKQQFGIERLQNEVKKLQSLNQALEEKCVAGENVKKGGGVMVYKPKNLSDWECKYSTKFSGHFTYELKNRQSERLHSLVFN